MQCSNMIAPVNAFLLSFIAKDCIRLQVLPGVRMTMPSLGHMPGFGEAHTREDTYLGMIKEC